MSLQIACLRNEWLNFKNSKKKKISLIKYFWFSGGIWTLYYTFLVLDIFVNILIQV